MYKVGLTGSIGSGKSTVSSIIEERGYVILDADEISRNITKNDKSVIDALAETFGREILLEDGEINRAKLAEIAFSNEKNKAFLSDIVTNRVVEILIEETRNLEEKGLNIVFLDIPLLFEYEFDKIVDEIWVVTADTEVRFKRAHRRDGISREDFDRRDNAQLSQEEKEERGDVIIKNDGDLYNLLERINYELVRIETIESKEEKEKI